MTTVEEKVLRAATAALKSARLTAKASKAKLRALKSEAKIQKQHYKWARQQVRLAKETLAQLRSTAEAGDSSTDGTATEHAEASARSVQLAQPPQRREQPAPARGHQHRHDAADDH